MKADILRRSYWRQAFHQSWEKQQVALFEKMNGMLYFLRKIPWLGKKIPLKIFADEDTKTVLFWFVAAFSLLTQIIFKFIWLFGLSFLAKALSSGFSVFPVPKHLSLADGFSVWVIWFALWWMVMNGMTDQMDQKELAFARNFALSPTVFLKNTAIVNCCYQMIYYLPALLVYAILFRNPFYLLNGMLLYLGGYLFGLWATRVFYIRKFTHRTAFFIGYSLVMLGLAIGGAFSGAAYYFSVVFRNFLLFPFLLAAVVLLLTRLGKFKKENEYLHYRVEKGNIAEAALVNVKNQGYFATGVEMQKKLTLTDAAIPAKYTGSQYLNALLFARYRPMLYAGMKRRVAGLLAAVVLAIILGILARRAVAQKELLEIVTMILPLLFFVFYLLGYGKKIVQMVFVNCDIAMLYYPFYREPRAIINGFLFRFKKTVQYNAVLALGVWLIFAAFGIASGNRLPLTFYGVLTILLVALMLLFSFHELFIYYILQPFTSDMEVVNPIYRIVSGALYWISYINTQIHTSGFTYSLIISAVVFVYFGVGMVFLYRKAPQTFKIKN
ncbi:MAG: hypothetical protein LKJ03_00585 [Enterococcaceae bacterium]|jgi:hypothetical protein|nr:hypothetical protein [Enterococcaceae bacterium]MCI1919277.1 hypothetical protein [Enterococcaceae bacterium]